MEILEYLDVVRRNLWRIVLLGTTAGCIAFGTTYALQEQFDATALLLVTPTDTISLSPSKDDKELLDYPVASSGTSLTTPALTYIEILKSRAVLERVVRELDLDAPDPADEPANPLIQFLRDNVIAYVKETRQYLFYGRIIGDKLPFENALEALHDNLNLASVKDTYLFEITYSHEDSERAAAVANVVTDIFLDYMHDMQSSQSSRALALMEQRLRESERELEATRQALRVYKEAIGVIDFDSEVGEFIKLLGEMESDLEKKETSLAGLATVLGPDEQSLRLAQAERDRLAEALADRRARVETLPEQERKLANLILAANAAENIYDLIRTEYEESRLAVAKANQEMRLISPAVASKFPARPIRVKYAGIVFVLALWIGVGLAFVLEYLNPNLRTVSDVEDLLKLTVLATIPLER